MAREVSGELLCWLKGPALAVLLVLGRDGGAKHSKLAAATGWGRNTTYTALGKLAGASLARRDDGGRWLLTPAGARAWAELTGAATLPESGTEGNGVPQNGSGRPSVPANGTKKGKPVPRSGRSRGKSMPGNGTKRPKSVPGNGTAPTIDHDVHVVDDDPTAINNIIRRLEALPKPFRGAAEWAPQQDQRLLVRWLDYMEQAPDEWHQGFTSSTAYMRTQVEAGAPPPRLSGRRQKRRACVTCGRSVWDADGSCLVCAGVVKC